MGEPPEGDYEVWRQDDAGNRYVIKSGLTGQEARRLIAEYERRGHKQMHWIRRSPKAGIELPDECCGGMC